MVRVIKKSAQQDEDTGDQPTSAGKDNSNPNGGAVGTEPNLMQKDAKGSMMAEEETAVTSGAEAARAESVKNNPRTTEDENADQPTAENERQPKPMEVVHEDGPGAKRIETVNGDGFRKVYANYKGDLTEIDDDTARTLYENPKYYQQLFDAGTQQSVDAHSLRWVDTWGRSVDGAIVGEPYRLDEKFDPEEK